MCDLTVSINHAITIGYIIDGEQNQKNHSMLTYLTGRCIIAIKLYERRV